ncbi:MAG TPA: ROK family protein [Streptosporangiaceae bacterium]
MVGRPPVVLGLDFGGTKIAVAVCDLQGNRLASATVSTGARPPATTRRPGGPSRANAAPDGRARVLADGRAGAPADGRADSLADGPAALADGAPALADGGSAAQTVFQRGIRAARGLLATAAPGSDLVAVGAATFGIPFDDRVELAPAIEGWESLALGRELREAFRGAVVEMATDAKAAAAAEFRWGALRGCDPGVYLNLGTGLSAALVAGGQVIAGGNGAAGEIGYNLRALSDVGLELGRRTMLEERVSGLALARRASNLPGRPRPLSGADVFAAGPGDKALSELITEFTDELAFHLVNLAILVNPARIAVGGGLVRSWDRIGPRLGDALRAGPPFPPELVLAHFPYDAPLLGAVALAVSAADRATAPTTGTPVATFVPIVPEATKITPDTDGTRITSGTLNNNTHYQA